MQLVKISLKRNTFCIIQLMKYKNQAFSCPQFRTKL